MIKSSKEGPIKKMQETKAIYSGQKSLMKEKSRPDDKDD